MLLMPSCFPNGQPWPFAGREGSRMQVRLVARGCCPLRPKAQENPNSLTGLCVGIEPAATPTTAPTENKCCFLQPAMVSCSGRHNDGVQDAFGLLWSLPCPSIPRREGGCGLTLLQPRSCVWQESTDGFSGRKGGDSQY